MNVFIKRYKDSLQACELNHFKLKYSKQTPGVAGITVGHAVLRT